MLCFNGDLNWFNVADREFAGVNQRVLANDAILGNVEAEFDSPAGDAGCGCAYPNSVYEAVVERSNQIHRQLKATANRHEHLRQRIAQLPMFARYQVAGCRVGCVVNNGAAGMPNFKDDLAGLCTRISTTPSPHPVLHETRVAGAYVALVPVRFDAERWRAEFLAQWPVGSAAKLSYFQRIIAGPAFASAQALSAV